MDPNSINPSEVELREQDRWLPIANVARLMKNTLPGPAKVSKDAKECMQECVSEFISFVTSEASDRCIREKRKTINGEDILYSMHDLGFENYAEVLKIFLAKYREQQALKHERGETKQTKKQLKAAQAAAAAAAAATTSSGSGAPGASQGGTIGSHSDALDEGNEEDSDDNSNVSDGIETRQRLSSNSPDPEQEQMNQHATNQDSIGSQESFFDQYESNNETANTNANANDNPNTNNQMDKKHSKLSHDVHKDDGYGYNDFMDHNENQPNIDELTKQLTNDDADIDTLTAGITNGSGGNDYF